jgi:hypothetical protein
VGYKVHVDENVNPGKYGFRLTHDAEKTHYFCSEEQATIREWMKALMKATIGRDYTSESLSNCYSFASLTPYRTRYFLLQYTDHPARGGSDDEPSTPTSLAHSESRNSEGFASRKP